MKFSSITIGLVLALGLACRPASVSEENGAPALQAHFVGMEKFAALPNAGKWSEVRRLPESPRLYSELLNKLAQAPRRFFLVKTGEAAADVSPVLRPLIEEALQRESYLEVRGTPDRPDVALALQLDPSRGDFWDSNLRATLSALKFKFSETNSAAGSSGLEARSAKPDLTFSSARKGSWYVIGLGKGELSAKKELLSKLESGSLPLPLETNFFVIKGSVKSLREWIPSLPEAADPQFEFFVRPRGTGEQAQVVVDGRFLFPKGHGWKAEPWKIPQDLLFDPITSFSAAQGFRGWLKEQQFIKEVKPSQVPNQAFAWSQQWMPTLFFVSFPYPGAAKELQAITPRVAKAVSNGIPWGHIGRIDWATNVQSQIAATNSNRQARGATNAPVTYITNSTEIVWFGLPMLMPFLRPVQHNDTEFVVGGLFPAYDGETPAPEELLKQVQGHTNLVYYGWEITGERVSHWRSLSELLPLLTDNFDIHAELPGQKWLVPLQTRLANCGTRITSVSPTEWKVVRNSELGLTGFELVALMRWMDSPGFPLPEAFAPKPRSGSSKEEGSGSGAAGAAGRAQPAPASGKSAQ